MLDQLHRDFHGMADALQQQRNLGHEAVRGN
jgi:hypothetical protein